MKQITFDFQETQVTAMAELYARVWGSEVETARVKIARYQTYSGFKAVLLVSNKEELIGFAYGYTSSPGQYYHDLLAAALTADRRQWLDDCFEFVELVVDKAMRRLGGGRILVQSLMEATDCQKALLTTQMANQPAITLYKQLNWVAIQDDFLPSSSGEPYVMMGKVLK
ncbi:GNAT family N-acetyltransferase [Shouchella xiaoxiensis]|uniref:GNAT family N-acetyltransferase n=1 Tax=Shouchella xiaoxiensis TaxID=766895 RepID=UPI00346213B2